MLLFNLKLFLRLTQNYVGHGFLRAPDGDITTFDVPGAGSSSKQGTLAECIKPTGQIPGYHTDASGVNHGFVRAPNSFVTTFDVPAAGT